MPACRFWSKVDQSGAGCWPWLGAVERTGYGRVKIGGRASMAHRVAFALANGALDRGLVVDHICRNRLCCNPAHLESVTQRENILRGTSPSAVAAQTGRCLRGHDLRRALIRKDGGRDCRECNTIRKQAQRAAKQQEVTQ